MSAVKHCTNNASQKAAEVAEGMRQFGNHASMKELYLRGCFRHLEDVAYARIALEKFGASIDRVVKHLDGAYEGPRACAHRCDRVYPSS
jgi:hypothetical protein